MTSTEPVCDNQLLPQPVPPPHLPPPPILTVSNKILRSPSHESVTTDLSLFSVSSAASDGAHGVSRRLLTLGKEARGHSPNPDARTFNRPAGIPEILWFEEETDVIRNCAALSSAVGLQKSFSTSDISQLPSPEDAPGDAAVRSAVSELALNALQRNGFLAETATTRFDHTSRSCSTWVAIGDVVSTSQLPSPHGGHSSTAATVPPTSTPPPPAFTAADFVRSVNKKVRQNYIRRRLLTTYKALERLSQSEFNLDQLEVSLTTSVTSAGIEEPAQSYTNRLTVPGVSPLLRILSKSQNAALIKAVKQTANNLPLTIRDVEREKGIPLSKYERNMMIFNWLHTLDENTFVEGVQ